MRILYIDESHSKNFYVLGGILINDTGFDNFCKNFDKFLADTFDLGPDIELKADDLWNRRGFWQDKNMDERADAVKEIVGHLKSTKLNCIVAYTPARKANDHDKYFELLPYMLEEAAKITARASGSTKRHLMIIFDERADFRKERLVHVSIAEKKANIIKNLNKHSCRIFDYGYEGISTFSRVLQTADFLAFFYKAFLEIEESPSLFSGATDKRKIELLKRIFGIELKSKLTVKKHV